MKHDSSKLKNHLYKSHYLLLCEHNKVWFGMQLGGEFSRE